MRTKAERDALAAQIGSGGASLPDKLNVIAAVLEIVRKGHEEELKRCPTAWAALHVAQEKLAEAEFSVGRPWNPIFGQIVL